uniref:Calmodulin-binding domain-containing protein n=1 Tax=Oryza punctata TaxID=4537 RepID=A0A0E0MNZ0_ORYPU
MTKEVIKEVIIVSTPESAKSKSGDCPKNSPENVDGSSVPPDLKRKEKPIPHYLRASTGSCHDNCKFGVHNSSESKKYRPVRRRRHQDRANAGCGKQGQDEIKPQKCRSRNKDLELKICLVKDGNVHDKPEFIEVKKPLIETAFDNSESSPCVQDQLSDEASEHVEDGTDLPCDHDKCLIPDENVACFVDGESSEGAVSIELEMPLAIQDSDASDDHITDAILPSEGVHRKQLLVDDVSDGSENEFAGSEKRSTQIVMTSEKREKSAHGTKSKSLYNDSVKPKAKLTVTATRNNASSQKIGRTSDRKASGTTIEGSNGWKVVRATKLNTDKKFRSAIASDVPKVKEIKVTSPANVMDQSSKPTRQSKLKSLVAKDAPSPSVNSAKQTGRKMTVMNVAKNARVWQKKEEEKISPVKLSRSINLSSRSLLSIKMRAVKKEKPASPMKSNKKVYGAENDVADTKEKNLKSASPKVRKVEVNKKESRPQKEKSATPRTENTKRPKSAIVSSTIQTQSPRRLTFRRGKVLNLQSNSESSNNPRRLRFRPAKTAEDSNRSNESTTRGRRTTKNSDSATSSGSKDSGSSKPEVVVLRHQDVKDKKKNEQGLFNNVIEETASKLVEARKSKVKALVGAFETVISLQESKVALAPAAALS